jgi:hypothetical protein
MYRAPNLEIKKYPSETLAREAEQRWMTRGRTVKRVGNKLYLT